jgi:hypothetical protein
MWSGRRHIFSVHLWRSMCSQPRIGPLSVLGHTRVLKLDQSASLKIGVLWNALDVTFSDKFGFRFDLETRVTVGFSFLLFMGVGNLKWTTVGYKERRGIDLARSYPLCLQQNMYCNANSTLWYCHMYSYRVLSRGWVRVDWLIGATSGGSFLFS